MPDIPGLPQDFIDARGVEMVPPPAEIIQDTLGVIGKALQHLGDDEKAKLVWIAQYDSRGRVIVNAALAAKVKGGVEVALWIGKTWGRPFEAGIAGSKSWR